MKLGLEARKYEELELEIGKYGTRIISKEIRN